MVCFAVCKSQPIIRISASFDPSAVRVDTSQSSRAVVRPTSLLHHYGHEGASQAYEAAALQILELAQSAYSSYVTKNPREQARLAKTVVSNSTFDRGSLSPTYIKPFDVFANGGNTGDWLAKLDSKLRGGPKRLHIAQPADHWVPTRGVLVHQIPNPLHATGLSECFP